MARVKFLPDTETRDPRRSARLIVLAGIALIGVALRTPGLSDVPLWIDEEFTLHIASGALGSILSLRHTSHPPGYPLLAHLSLLFSSAPWVIRVPALLGGVLGIGVIYLLLRDLGYERSAFAGALLVATSVYCAYYSQEARGYTWMSSLCGLQLLFGARYVRRPAPSTLSLFLASGLLACMFHFLAVLVCAPLLAVVLAFDLRRRFRNDPPCSWTSLAPWLVAVGGAALALLVLRERVAALISAHPFDAETGLAVGWRFVAEHVSRWHGLGSQSAPWILFPVALGAIELGRRAQWISGLHLTAAVAPFLFAAVVPWNRFYQDRYLMAALIPVLAIATAGVPGVLESVRASLRASRPAAARVAAAGWGAALAVLTLVQGGHSLEYARAPGKIIPGVESSPFYLRHLALVSYFDPWLVRSRSRSATPLVMTEFDGARVPVPRWPSRNVAAAAPLSPCLQTMQRKGMLFLVNPRADDAIQINVGLARRPRERLLATLHCGEPFYPRGQRRKLGVSGEPAVSFAIHQVVSGEATGYGGASFFCGRGTRVDVLVRFDRPALARSYLDQVLDRAVCVEATPGAVGD